MSRKLQQNVDALRFLIKCNPKQREAVIKHASNGLIDSLCECALNLLKGHVPLHPKQKKKLSTHKDRLRALSNKRMARKKKRVILSQRGGFVGTLLAPIVSSLLPIILSQLKKKR